MYLNSTWGTVCKEPYWDVLESKVACASQCFPASEVNHDVIAGSGPIVIGNVQCSGDERILQSCTYSKPDTSFCGHYMDAGVKCFESKLPVEFETNTVLTFNSSTKCVGIPALYTTAQLIATQFTECGCMDDLVTERSFDSLATVQTFNFCTSRPDVCQCLVVWKAMLRCQENNLNISMTHVACESKLRPVIRSSIHPSQGNWVSIEHTVVFYAQAAQAFSAGIKCRHCTWVIDVLGLFLWHLIHGCCRTMHWQTYGRRVRELNVCTVQQYRITIEQITKLCNCFAWIWYSW